MTNKSRTNDLQIINKYAKKLERTPKCPRMECGVAANRSATALHIIAGLPNIVTIVTFCLQNG
jgi:hypothetical protein